MASPETNQKKRRQNPWGAETGRLPSGLGWQSEETGAEHLEKEWAGDSLPLDALGNGMADNGQNPHQMVL